jgi:hypothetical protein
VAYAALGDVQARAGALSGRVDGQLEAVDRRHHHVPDDVAAEIDAALAGRGLAITDPASPAGKALKNVNALGALVLALQATYPEGSGPSSASKAIDDARGEFDGLMASIMDGTHPAVRSLEAGTATTRATSFWEQEPYYGEFPFDPRLDPLSPDANPNTAPAFARGQSL